MSASTRILGVAAATLALSTLAAAHVRLQHPGNGNKLFWTIPSGIGIVINATGSDDVLDMSHLSALRGAIAAWNADAGSVAKLVENTTPSQMARTDWAHDNIHLLFFDETDSSGYFPPGSGTVALTPLWFSSGGAISDADVLFNGSGFAFTTSGEVGQFDIEDVATHELGHLLGLDHSGWAGASMYPYVDPTITLHRSPSLDDVCGLRDVYPNGAFASIFGTVRRADDDSLVPGASVVALDSTGRSAAGALASNAGVFQLRGLAPDTYTLYATPLDHPVSAANLTSGHTVDVDFASTWLGDVTLSAGQMFSTGDVEVDADVALSLGRNSDPYPLRCVAGAMRTHTVRGSGLVPGSTLTSSDPTLTITPVAWLGTQVTFQVTVPAGAPRGHADLVVENAASALSILPAALEITPLEPIVTDVSPTTGSDAGGTAITITGSRFESGSRVALGGVLYRDGVAGGCVVVDDQTITLTTAASFAGLHDLVVLDPSGVEGRKSDAFQFADVPVVDTLFPVAGSAAGGTELVVRGSDFLAGAIVRIDGVQQTTVEYDSPTRLSVVTDAGVPGGPYVVEVENPGGATASSAFSYVASPDPTIATIDPAVGSSAGGETIVITGSGFTATSVVEFGASVDTGLGGVEAADVTLVDASTLEVVTPAITGGAKSVLVLDSASGQAVVSAAAFTFSSSGGGGGGGGGCSVAPVNGPRDPYGPLSSGLALLALCAAVAHRARVAKASLAASADAARARSTTR